MAALDDGQPLCVAPARPWSACPVPLANAALTHALRARALRACAFRETNAGHVARRAAAAEEREGRVGEESGVVQSKAHVGGRRPASAVDDGWADEVRA